MQLQTLVSNIKAAQVRNETMEGREYLVVPMVMLTEGVHAGTNGPLFYSEKELSKTPVVWNQKPIVVYHPTMNGVSISACDPDVITAQKVGVIMNTTWDGKTKKLRAEAWLEKERANTVDIRVLQAVDAKSIMEVSTGLFTDNDFEEGTYNGKAYQYAAKNFRPDHLALLPDVKGACSIEDGAGLLQVNEASHGDLRQAIQMAVQVWDNENDPKPDDRMGMLSVYVTDVYNTYFVYEDDGKLFRMGYTNTPKGVEVDGNPVEVVRVTEYRTVAGGSFSGNATSHIIVESDRMKKKVLVDALIANSATQWTEADRALLMANTEETLEKMAPVEPTPTEPTAEEKAAAEKAAVDAAAALAAQNQAKPPVTAEAYIAGAPPEIRDMLAQGLAANQAEKARLVGVITANKANVFTAAALNAKGTDELRGLAALASASSQPAPLFSGAAAPVGNSAPVVEEPLVMPAM